MHKISTLNKLVPYAYNETGLIEGDQTQRAIDGDPLVAQEYREIVEMINILDQVHLVPSEDCIKRILAHS